MRVVERYRLSEGLVVGRKPLPAGDVILSFVGPEGAAQAIARKALRPTGRSGRLSLFHHLKYQVYQKPGNELPTLTQVELVGRLEGLEAPDRFPYASFLAELAFRLASPEVAGRIWPLLTSGLKGIAKHPSPRMALLWAAWRVLKAAGLAPNLSGEGLCLLDGERSERGVYLGPEGLEALAAILQLPGTEAIALLEAGAPLDRLQQALLAHVRYAVGELGSAQLLAPSHGKGSK
ncbi:MAG: recombination protein O N-terminal domain-containing protein [Meiothermus sp.]|uniref:DNA repair protein RecO n=1 Tax=Meiothermus sp. TaxID=1955249 RepID=UPI0025E20145|nr:recombination protein O N-terminal domain-containing protein [Meiothermus sp.]MCS7069666.1 recombination protein O N-terminal domain-containing protein [Meiothermus sp.]MDW8426439.1 recombination protein O N-terminal domain-containing protein [Meiothermus sp.]